LFFSNKIEEKDWSKICHKYNYGYYINLVMKIVVSHPAATPK